MESGVVEQGELTGLFTLRLKKKRQHVCEVFSNRNKKINSIQRWAFEIFIHLKHPQGTEKSPRWLLCKA